ILAAFATHSRSSGVPGRGHFWPSLMYKTGMQPNLTGKVWRFYRRQGWSALIPAESAGNSADHFTEGNSEGFDSFAPAHFDLSVCPSMSLASTRLRSRAGEGNEDFSGFGRTESLFPSFSSVTDCLRPVPARVL